MKRITHLALGASALLGFAALAAPVAAGADGLASAPSGASSTHIGYTYVNDNTAGSNTIAGFDRGADGSLTPITGSPFTVGGAGLGSGLASQGAIQATSNGKFLVAVDAGSNQISVLRVTANGVPVPVGLPVSSGGDTPVSVAISPTGLVFVANQGAADSNYSGFQLKGNGSLTPIASSTFSVPAGSGLGDVFFNSSGTELIGTRTGTSLIDSFLVAPDGELTPAQGSPFTGQGLGQLGSEFSPTNPSQLFVSDAHNGPGLGEVSAYNDGVSGQLTSIGAGPYGDGQTAPCWVEISHNGQFLYTVNTGSGTISSFAIKANGSLRLVGSTVVNGGGADIDARLSPDGRYLLVDGAGHDFVSVFAVHGGSLAELATSPTPLPVGASSSGIVNI